MNIFSPFLIALSMLPAICNATLAQDIIRRADEIRSPNKPFRYTVTVHEYKDIAGEAVNKQIFDVSMRFMKPENGRPADARSLVRFIYPARDKGKVMLSDWYDLWFYSPELRRPMPVSPEQRLVGQIANSDVIVTNFDYSYHAHLTGETTCGNIVCYRLSLERKTAAATYPKIVYLVEKESSRPYTASFYSQDEKLLKEVRYKDYQTVLGEARPMKIIVQDARHNKGFTVMEYSNVRLESLPEFYFTREAIQRGVR